MEENPDSFSRRIPKKGLPEISIFLEDALKTDVEIVGYQLYSKLPSSTSTAIVCAEMKEMGNPAMTPCLMDLLLLISMPLTHSILCSIRKL